MTGSGGEKIEVLTMEDVRDEEEFFCPEPVGVEPREEGAETMAQYLDDYLGDIKDVSVGTLLKGHVIKITPNEVYVDINHKTEGVVPIGEFEHDEEPPKVGDELEVLVVKMDENDGTIQLSRNKARLLKAWDLAEEAFNGEGIIRAKVVAKVKGGLSADFHGLKAFIPGSLMSLQQEYDLEKYVGKHFDFKIIEFNRKRRNMVLSRKAILEEERKKIVAEILEKLKPGQVVKGVVKNITDYGAFISIEDGQIDGLLHKADMSWSHVRDVNQVLEVGQELEVMILNVDKEHEKISLGLKQLTPDPWNDIEEKLRVGEIVKGKVRNITHFGVFVEVAEGIEGLVHISDMSWTERIKHPSEMCSIDEEIEVKILDINPEERKIALGIKQIYPDPWSTIQYEYQIGEVVTGKVKHLTDFGAFVELKEGVEGLIHISDLSWVGRVKHPSEILSEGQEIEVKILDMNPQEKKISLGFKQVNPDPWELVEDNYPVGSVVHGRITKVTDFGAFVELKDGIEGLIHKKDLSWEKVEDPAEVVSEGQEVDVKVLDIDKRERRISLGLKQMEEDPWCVTMKKYPVGSVVEGRITRLTPFGAFVEIEDGIEGLLHVSDISWTERVEHPQDKLSEGETIKVKILDIDFNDRKISLGLKQLTDDPIGKFLSEHPIGSIVDGVVSSVTEKGALVKVTDDLEILVPPQQYGCPPDQMTINLQVPVKVLEFDRKERKLRGSVRQAREEEERRAYEEYTRHSQREVESSLADILDSETKEKLKQVAAGLGDEKKE